MGAWGCITRGGAGERSKPPCERSEPRGTRVSYPRGADGVVSMPRFSKPRLPYDRSSKPRGGAAGCRVPSGARP
jgi:hypothetical protein